MLPEIEIEKIRSLFSKRRGIAYVFLFGSALRRLLPHSDIDFLVGGELNQTEKDDLLMELTIELKRPVDILFIQEAPCEVVLRAFSTGIPILLSERGRVKEDYLKNYRLYDQKVPLKRIRIERLKRVYGCG
ncbi:MAG: nucleotidyltransferase domain-containing protein [Thermodesulfobacteriota bacterium]